MRGKARQPTRAHRLTPWLRSDHTSRASNEGCAKRVLRQESGFQTQQLPAALGGQPSVNTERSKLLATTTGQPLTEADLARIETLLSGLPQPLRPMDLSALDGYLCGVLLQPRPVPLSQWWPAVLDVDARAVPDNAGTRELQQLVLRRHSELDTAITQRQWFDPWVFAGGQDDDDAAGATDNSGEPGSDGDDRGTADATQAILPWVAGFAAAMEHFPQLMERTDADLVEPMALLFQHFDPADLEDADALLEMIESLEPPADLAEAVQDTVRALMLIADVSRPRRSTPERPAPRQNRRAATGRTPLRGAPAARAGGAPPRGTSRTNRKR
jgi:uncharacterized protein